MTVNQKKFADKIIKLAQSKKANYFTLSEIYEMQGTEEGLTLSIIQYTISVLLYKGFLAYGDDIVVTKSTLFLTDLGWQYESYDQVLAKEQLKYDLELKQIEASITASKSVVDTNESVKNTNSAIKDASDATATLYGRTETYYKHQRAATWVIAGATIINI